MSLQVLVNPKAITVIISGRSYLIQRGSPAFDYVRTKWLEGDLDSLDPSMFVLREQIREFCGGDFKFDEGRGLLYYKNEPCSNYLLEKVIQFIESKEDPQPLLRCHARLQKNPSKTARESLIEFICSRHIGLTENGMVIAYKAVRSDYLSITSGTRGRLDNTPGNTVTEPRSEVIEDRLRPCAAGLHAGTWQYVNWFKSDDSRIVMVLIDPLHAVSVPSDDGHVYDTLWDGSALYTKLRVCEYFVLADVTEECTDSRGNLTCPYDSLVIDMFQLKSANPKLKLNIYGMDFADDVCPAAEYDCACPEDSGTSCDACPEPTTDEEYEDGGDCCSPCSGDDCQV